jgi:hypothetical protein
MARRTRKKTLQDLIDQFIPEIRKAFQAAIENVVDNVIIKDVIDAIEAGDINAAFRALGFSDAAMRPITVAIERAFEAGGVFTAEGFPKRLNTPSGKTVFRFDVRNSRAEAWLRDESSKLVTKLSDDAFSAVQSILQDNMIAGRNPRNTALDLVGRIDPITRRRTGGIVGLNGPQERAVANARKDLQELNERYFTRVQRDKRFDRIVRKAIDTKTPLTPEDVNRLTGRYSDNLLRLRGETIARTESIAALNRSEYEALKQATDLGGVKSSATKRIWDSAGDARVRHDHQKMDGQTVGIDEPFTAPDGSKLMYPGDTSLGASAKETINCRCRVRLKVDWLADIN